MAFGYPVALELTGRVCVVVGGDEMAEQRIRGLLQAGARVRVIAELITGGIEELVSTTRIELRRRRYIRGDLEGAFLALQVGDDRSDNAALFAEAHEYHVLLNCMDDIPHCHFAQPAVVRRGDLAITISTGGKAPALAKAVRRKLAGEFGDEYGRLVDLLGRIRAEFAPRRVDFEEWSARWTTAMDEDLVGLVRDGREREAEAILRSALSGRKRVKTGRVAIVGAGPGDPSLITVKGRALIEAADVLVYDRLVHPSLVDGKPAIFVGKMAGRHYVTQEEINDLLVSLAEAGDRVVRLKGGDPFVFGRGAEEAAALAAAGIAFEIVPAPTSGTAALAYAGIPVTDRRYTSSVAFATGHGEIDLRGLAASAGTIVVYMGLQRIEEVVTELIAGGRSPDEPAAVVAKGTYADQRVVEAPLAGLAKAVAREGVEAPALIVAGEVVRLRDQLSWFGSKPGARQNRAASV